MGATTSKEASPPPAQQAQPPQPSKEVPIQKEDYNAPLRNGKLPAELQQMVDNEESLLEMIYDGRYVILSNICSPVSSC